MYTCRDREVARWLAEFGAATAGTVGDRFASRRSWTYQRLRSLVGDGLLTEHRLLYRQAGLYAATAQGLRWSGLERLGVQRVSPGGFEHLRQVAAVAAQIDRASVARRVLSERMLRAAEQDENRLLGSIRLGEMAGRRVLHRPDLALRSEQRTVAIEVELSQKAPCRLQAICRGYARTRHIDHTYYLAPANVGRGVERAIKAVRAEERITVLALNDIDGLAARERAAT